MKPIILFACLFLTKALVAQTFIEVPPDFEFEGLHTGAAAYSDVDSDGDQDVLMTGLSNAGSPITKLYLNNGAGQFPEAENTPFDRVWSSAVTFADVDNDGDEDVLISGWADGLEPVTKLYSNDGMGHFTEITGTPFEAVGRSSAAFADMDNDGDRDVLIQGRNASFERIAKLYTNDGSGNFAAVTELPFDSIKVYSFAIADVDNDSYHDILITGWEDAAGAVAKLYKNDSTGNFSPATDSLFEINSAGTVVSLDLDTDGDKDVLLSATNGLKLYTNDGMGNFTETAAPLLENIRLEALAFSDVDGDGDPDGLVTGEQGAKLYKNEGSGNFTEGTVPPFISLSSRSIAFPDVDGDGDEDVLISGQDNPLVEAVTRLYINDGTGRYTGVLGPANQGVSSSSVAFSDVDGDGDEDVLVTGERRPLVPTSALYLNDGTGSFTEAPHNTPFEAVWSGAAAFADVDGDSDEDVVISGRVNQFFEITKLYLNDGTGNFSEAADTPFDSVYGGDVTFSDIDGDSDLDVLISGRNSLGDLFSGLYFNDGTGGFSEAVSTPFDGTWSGSTAFADIDDDGDPDLLITGRTSLWGGEIAKLYLNDGTGSFSEVFNTPFEGVHESSITFLDADNDGDEDVLITGRDNQGKPLTKLYTNDSTGNFTEASDTPFEGVRSGAVAVSDIDSDGDEDVLITGKNDEEELTTKLYRNEGSGNFTELTGTGLVRLWLSSAGFSDIDGDGDQDVLMTGENNAGEPITRLYLNEGPTSSSRGLSADAPLDFVLFPNPARSATLFVHHFAAGKSELTFRLYQADGVLVKQQRELTAMGRQTFSIDIASLPTGSYFLEMDNGKGRGVAKFVVQ